MVWFSIHHFAEQLNMKTRYRENKGKYEKKGKKMWKEMSEVGFEPTPSLEDQNLSLAP